MNTYIFFKDNKEEIEFETEALDSNQAFRNAYEFWGPQSEDWLCSIKPKTETQGRVQEWQSTTKEMLALEYADSVKFKSNFPHCPYTAEEAFKAGYDSALACFKEHPAHSLYLNALMLLDNKGLKLLADSIYLKLDLVPPNQVSGIDIDANNTTK